MAVSARELIFGRSSQLKVFVSSKMAGGALKPERQAAVRKIESFPSMRAWHWERDAVAGTFYSEEECVGNAATSEVLVLILEDELTEITRKEYFAAKRAGAHRVVLHRTGVGRSTRLERFIDRERKRDAVTAGYGNVSELETRLFEALREVSVRPVRERMLRLREATRQVSRAYDDLDICVGEDQGTLQPLSDAITEARQLVRGGDVDEAYNVMYGFAEQALSVGLVGVANHLVEDLRDIIPAAALDERREGWVLNVEGRALSAAGQADAARARFDRMRQLGRSLDDHDLESTALQNLGIEEIEAGNYDEAMRVHRDALMLKRDAGDVYGGLQVLRSTCLPVENSSKRPRRSLMTSSTSCDARVYRPCEPAWPASAHG
jgi:tetratricopeptide (TPR) repeat protein